MGFKIQRPVRSIGIEPKQPGDQRAVKFLRVQHQLLMVKKKLFLDGPVEAFRIGIYTGKLRNRCASELCVIAAVTDRSVSRILNRCLSAQGERIKETVHRLGGRTPWQLRKHDSLCPGRCLWPYATLCDRAQ